MTGIKKILRKTQGNTPTQEDPINIANYLPAFGIINGCISCISLLKVLFLRNFHFLTYLLASYYLIVLNCLIIFTPLR